MRCFARPVVVFSRCLGFAACRYDGEIVVEPAVEALKLDVEARPYCPELEIGLGVPRDPIRLVSSRGGASSRTADDGTRPHRVDAEGGRVLPEAPRRGGRVRPEGELPLVWAQGREGLRRARERGAALPYERALRGGGPRPLPDLPIVSEKTLRRPAARRHALTRLFAAAGFRSVRASGRSAGARPLPLGEQAPPSRAQRGGRAGDGAARGGPQGPAARRRSLRSTRRRLAHALSRPRGGAAMRTSSSTRSGTSRRGSRARRRRLSSRGSTSTAREGATSAHAWTAMRDWIAHFEEPYLAAQTYFEPFPWPRRA